MAETTDPAAAPRTARILHGAILAGLLLFLGAVYVLGRATPPRGDEAAWWGAHLPRAISIWALAEAAGIAGGVFWWVSGDAVLGLGLAGLALAILLWTNPGRLTRS